MYHLYVLKSEHHNKTYIGISENVTRRLSEHNGGKVKSTKGYTPYQLIHTEEFENKTEARKREIRLKKHSQTKEHLFKELGLW